MKQLVLKKGKEASVKRFHPWVFSGAVKRQDEDISDGEEVEVLSYEEQYLATGHYQQGGSIVVRICSFVKSNLKQNFWTRKIQQAYDYRKSVGTLDLPETNCYRLIHGEGDGLPGLIIDVYHQTAVVQCHSIGMHLAKEKITEALKIVLGDAIQAVYDKSATTLPSPYARTVESGYLWGNSEPGEVKEYGHRFFVDWEKGQKTGFFLDQRENRRLLRQYAAGKKVLNAFCYSGGFSIYALAAGASHVDSVDVSQKAMNWTDQNVALNPEVSAPHQSITADVMKFFKESEETYEVMVVDPPAFAKSLHKRHQAVQGYKRLNALALKKMVRGGILFTFSCSQVVDQSLFYNTIVAAAIEARRTVRVMHRLTQPADHPVSLFHPEGSYLKGLVLWVE